MSSLLLGHSSTSCASTSHASTCHVKSFNMFKKLKGQQWKSIVSKKAGSASDKEIEVQINIGLMVWSDKNVCIKPKRGKRLALRVSNKATYKVILQKVVEKWRAFNSDLYDENEDYILLLENGEEAQFLPGSSASKEFFSLKRYKEETGKDYNKIVLYLCKLSDFHLELNSESDRDTDELVEEPEKKRLKSLTTDEEPDASAVFASDEKIAIELQREFDNELSIDMIDAVENMEDGKDDNMSMGTIHQDISSVIKSLSQKVDQDGQFFIVSRRGSPFPRVLSLWQREANRSSPEKVLRVRYSGENGVDSGALSQEFLAQLINDMGLAVFPDGAPINSLYNVHNKSFKTCGEIIAVSLAQGGPAPSFLDESVYQLMLDPDVNIGNLDVDRHFTAKDKELFDAVRACDTFEGALCDVIVDHGYTGIIDHDHKEDVIGTMQLSIMTKRLLYMKEFCEGLKLYGAYDVIRGNASLCKPLFVKGSNQVVDANYVFSLVNPSYSEQGSSKRPLEEAVIDNLQDFLMSLEDEQITGYSEPVAWKDFNDTNTESSEVERFQSMDTTPSGVLGWLTGQKYRPLNGEPLNVTALFDHDCFTRNPNHTICFPRVAACSKEITFPVSHMKTPEQFKHVLLLAMCKGNAFGNA